MPYQEEVARGAAWLDRAVGPFWPLRVDAGLLEMGRCDRCIIGQVFDLTESEDASIFFSEIMETENLDPVEFGFDAYGLDEQYEELGEAWVAEIKRRLDAGISA